MQVTSAQDQLEALQQLGWLPEVHIPEYPTGHIPETATFCIPGQATFQIPGMPHMPIHIVQAEGENQVPMAEIQSALQASFQAYAVRQAEGQRAAQAAQHADRQAKAEKAKQRRCKQVSLSKSTAVL